MAKSLHEQAGLTPNLRLPVVAIAALPARDFKAAANHHQELHRVVMAWLVKLSRHPSTPARARRAVGPDGAEIVQIFAVEAINQAPWWRCLVAELDEAGRLQRSADKPDEVESMYFTPAVAPPRELVEALDEMSGHKLTNRGDGGPTPANPTVGGTGIAKGRVIR